MEKIGCFGSVLYYKEAANRCQACPLQVDCKAEVAINKEKLGNWFKELRAQAKTRSTSQARGKRGVQAISAPDAQPRVAAVVVATAPLTASGKVLPKKPKEFVEKWCKKGIKFEDYKQGVNPFKSCGNKFAEVAMQAFMDAPQGLLTKSQLCDVFHAQLGWHFGTAGSHANIVFDAFEYLGMITVTGTVGALKD